MTNRIISAELLEGERKAISNLVASKYRAVEDAQRALQDLHLDASEGKRITKAAFRRAQIRLEAARDALNGRIR